MGRSIDKTYSMRAKYREKATRVPARAQADKHLYAQRKWKKTIEKQRKLGFTRQELPEELIVEDGVCKGLSRIQKGASTVQKR